MKTTRIKLLLIFIVITAFSFAQENEYVDSIKIYAIRWNGKSPYAKNAEGIKKLPKFYFATSGASLNTFFIDYEDCINKLNSDKNITTSENLLNVVAVFVFNDKRKIEIAFDTKGNYLFKEKWHKINYEFYYTLFKYFSNEIIPKKILLDSKRKYKDCIWDE